MILYKIVRKKNRGSTVVSKNSKYYTSYIKGIELKDENNSLGFFCFKRKNQAINYLEYCTYPWNRDNKYMIIRLESLDVIHKLKTFCLFGTGLKEFYKNGTKSCNVNKDLNEYEYFKHVVLCKHIKVLD
jgi:hypothetical protein